MGTLGIVWIAIALVCAVLWRRPLVFAWVVAADLIGNLGSYGLRELIGRPRPSMRYASPHTLVRAPTDASFPSGHTTIAFACAAVLAYFKPRLAPPLFLLAAAIGFSRIYVGVHYPLDVVGGAALGLAIGALLIALRRLVAARRR
ncbi:MAG TPA: phosphatase PAP2 family protein [Gaiellaceae bacterium]